MTKTTKPMKAKPTDKKLTFVEFVAKEYKVDVEVVVKELKRCINNIIINGRHGHCRLEGCELCGLERRFSAYKKYFKQK